MNRTLAALALGLSALALTGCGNAPDTKVATVAETGVDGLTVIGPRLVLPAVAGNPAGVFFKLSYSGTGELVLEEAAVAQSQGAMIHDVVDKDGMKQMVPLGQLTIKAGDAVTFAPGGRHVMAMQLDEAVAPGGKVDVTLTFTGGKTARFAADVIPAGEMQMEH